MPEPTLRILVIEDHAGLGRFISVALSTAGWVVVGPYTDYPAAMHAAREAPVDFAIIDWLLAGQEALPIADALTERGIRYLLTSGHAREMLPERYRNAPFLLKPFTLETLVAAVRASLADKPD